MLVNLQKEQVFISTFFFSRTDPIKFFHFHNFFLSQILSKVFISTFFFSHRSYQIFSFPPYFLSQTISKVFISTSFISLTDPIKSFHFHLFFSLTDPIKNFHFHNFFLSQFAEFAYRINCGSREGFRPLARQVLDFGLVLDWRPCPAVVIHVSKTLAKFFPSIFCVIYFPIFGKQKRLWIKFCTIFKRFSA